MVVGASGYAGGRVVPALLEAGYPVRAAARVPSRTRDRPWASHPGVDLVEADVLDRDSLARASDGAHAALYLVHSMQPGARDFEDADRQGAQNMAWAASSAALDRIVYLGGLGDPGSALSAHLRSRTEVDAVMVDNAKVIRTDVSASNGVIHVIDSVILPK